MSRHMIPRGWPVAAVGLTLMAAAPCLAQRGSIGEPSNGASTIRRLEDAQYADRMNARSWTADNPTLDHYYDRKAAEVGALIGRLERGEQVAPADIDRALDTSDAQRY
ncbi:MAG TPA: hypothetical protein VKW76_09105 [Candidatus Binatia bacterium]|nr:hypothetical protein [Candidatus Binatia bacterium]